MCLALLIAAPLLAGCVPLALGSAAGMVGGGRTPASSADAGMPSGSGIQNGAAVDRSIGEALAASQGDVSETCRDLLPERRDDGRDDKRCEFRLICLPGANAPARLFVCEQTAHVLP